MDTDGYYNYYQGLTGGNGPVYRGNRLIPYGAGFGGIFGTLARHVIPILTKGATSFLENLMENKNKGTDWKAAAKAAIAPAGKAMAQQTATQMGATPAVQTGSGKRRRKHKKSSGYKKGKKKATKRKINFKTLIAKLPKYNF